MIDIYSFDVFDTAVTRIWAKPTDLFWLLGEKLNEKHLTGLLPETWAKLRIETEKKARNLSATGEVTLEQIYVVLGAHFGWTSSEMHEAMKQEVELESLSIRPIPIIKQKIDLLRKQNKRIIFVSDMYLPANSIQSLLKENGLWKPEDGIYVSSSVGINKISGELFHHVLKKENAYVQQMIHTGDNWSSDVIVPKKLGINATHFSQACLNRYEELALQVSDIELKFKSLLVGASKLTRLHYADSPEKRVIWDTAASVIGPLLFGFVYWCLEQAKRRNIRRLYFIARDGQILLKIAKIICKNWNYDIECRYLYGSRHAWHFPAIQEIKDFELDWIFDITQFLSVRSVCERVNLQPEQIKDVLVSHNFLANTWDDNLSQVRYQELRNLFATDLRIINLILTISSEYRKSTIAYFRQEKVDDGTPFAIVDIGWHGRLQQSFSTLLYSAGIYPETGVSGFYFALSKRFKAFPNENLYAYFVDPDISSTRTSISINRGLLELFVNADHGRTLRYELGPENNYNPVLATETNLKALNWGIEILQNSVITFSSLLTQHVDKNHVDSEFFLKISEVLLKEFIEHPSYQEAEIFGSFKFAEDQTENVFYELAPEYNIFHCFNLLLKNEYIHHNIWFPATKMRSPRVSQILLNSHLLKISTIIRLTSNQVIKK